MEPWKTKSPPRLSAWKALTGGWWDTCSDISLKPCSSLYSSGKKMVNKSTNTECVWWLGGCHTWWARRSLPTEGWTAFQFCPTGKPLLTQQRQLLSKDNQASDIRSPIRLWHFIRVFLKKRDIFRCLSDNSLPAHSTSWPRRVLHVKIQYTLTQLGSDKKTTQSITTFKDFNGFNLCWCDDKLKPFISSFCRWPKTACECAGVWPACVSLGRTESKLCWWGTCAPCILSSSARSSGAH